MGYEDWETVPVLGRRERVVDPDIARKRVMPLTLIPEVLCPRAAGAQGERQGDCQN
jgi:hypothetical protein